MLLFQQTNFTDSCNSATLIDLNFCEKVSLWEAEPSYVSAATMDTSLVIWKMNIFVISWQYTNNQIIALASRNSQISPDSFILIKKLLIEKYFI